MSDAGIAPSPTGGLADALSGVTGSIAKELPGAIAQDKADRAVTRGAAVDAVSAIDKGTKQREGMAAPPLPPPTPPPQYRETSMGDKWGSLAMGMAVLGSAFTKRPAINSLNAAAGVMNAYADSDAAAYKRNFERWKAETDYSLKMYEYQRDAYKDALHGIDKNTAEAMAKVRVIAAAFKDDALGKLAQIGNVAGALSLIDERAARLPQLKTQSEAAKVEGELINRFNVARDALRKNPTDPAALAEMQAIDAESKRLKTIEGGGASAATEPKAGTPEDLLARRVADYKAANKGQDPPNALREQWAKETHQLTSSGSQHVTVPHEYEVKDKDGNTVRTFTGQASTASVGPPLDMSTGKPVELKPGEEAHLAKPGSEGRQQATQLTAIRGAGNQAVKALKNLVELPITANLGALMGTQFKTPDDMATALRRSAAREFTPDETKKVQIAFAGVARNLATLEAQGRATGLVGLSEQMGALAPQSGDSPLIMMRRYAEIRQIIDASIENARASHKPTKELAELYDGIQRQAATAVPYTVSDVNDLERGFRAKKGLKNESAREFAEKMFAREGRPVAPVPAKPSGPSAAAPAATSSRPYADGDTATNPTTGEKLMYRGGKWEPAPPGAVDTR